MNGKLKIGIIGVGGISAVHIDAYRHNPHAELYALCDIDAEKLREKGNRYGIERLYTSAEEMLSALPELDAVSVCTWNSAHAPCAIAALNAGKHVLCEKPMAVNAALAGQMLEAARRNRRVLMVGFVRRFGQDCRLVKDFIDAGALGDVYFAKAKYIRRSGNPGGWFGDRSRSGGGPLIDLGVHVIDLLRYLMGGRTPVSVTAAAYNKLGNRPGLKLNTGSYLSETRAEKPVNDVEDFAAAFIRFDDDAVLSVETSFCLNGRDSAEVALYGDRGGVEFEPELTFFTESNGYLTDVTPVPAPGFDFENAFRAEIDSFIDAIRTGAPVQAPAEDGVMLMKLLDAAYESAATGREVRLD